MNFQTRQVFFFECKLFFKVLTQRWIAKKHLKPDALLDCLDNFGFLFENELRNRYKKEIVNFTNNKDTFLK